MFTSEVLQNLIIKTIYEVAITIINIINIYHIANRQLGVTKPIATIWYINANQLNDLKVPKWTP